MIVVALMEYDSNLDKDGNHRNREKELYWKLCMQKL